jgi:hypothetical protein
MRRPFLLAAAAAMLLSVTLTGAVLGAKPPASCPAAPSGWERVDVDEWWDRTVAGFEEAGIDVYESDGTTFTQEFDEFAAAFGFGDGAGLEFFVRVTQWAQIDKNENDLVCMKDWPNTPGTPPFFFGGVDDQAAATA